MNAQITANACMISFTSSMTIKKSSGTKKDGGMWHFNRYLASEEGTL